MGRCFVFRKMGHALALCVLAASVAGMAASAGEAGKAEYAWRFANYMTQPHVDEYFRKFCDKVTEYSGGRIVFRYYPDSQLGTHDEIFHAVQEGGIQCAQLAPYVHLVPGGMVNWMPWTVSSWKEFGLAFELDGGPKGPIAKLMPVAFAEVGMHPLFYRSAGGYGIGNRIREIRTPEDLRELKLRVSGSLGFVRALENMSKGFGMMFETMPFAEGYNALSKGVVDGLWAHWQQLLLDRHGEVLNYFADMCWAWDSNAVAINKELWDSLPGDLKDAINRAAEEVQPELAAAEQRKEGEIIAEIRMKMPHLKITTLTDAERDVFRQKANMPAIWDELCRPWLDTAFPGENMTERLQKDLDAIRDKAR